MLINELARMTGVNPETIRMYRKKGFLHPDKSSNGYYNYHREDFVSLVYLRKLRDFEIDLNGVSVFYSSERAKPVLDALDEEEKQLRKQISILEDKIRFVQLERRHVAECDELNNRKSKAMLMQSTDEKIDFYDMEPAFLSRMESSIQNFYVNTTPCLYISKDVLNGPIEDKEVPVKTGVGFYRNMVSEEITPTAHSVIVPNGVCIAQLAELQQLNTINVLQLAPMMEYAKKLKKPFLSDTTGYLAGISVRDGKRIFHFRIRACIEKNDIRDPEVMEYMEAHL